MREDVKALGIVLRRTNYGEADRILNIITPEGKISAMAKGARKEKSKLAGGIEMFTLAEFTVHKGRGDLGVVTSAKMREHYGGILKDYERMELAGTVLRKVNAAAEGTEGAELFELTRQSLAGLNEGMDVRLVEGWFWLNLARLMGEEANLYRDAQGEKLRAEARYEWDVGEMAFAERENGRYGADEIKTLRLMTRMKLAEVKRVRLTEEIKERVLDFARVHAKS